MEIVDLFVLMMLAMLFVFVWRSIVRSKWFNRFCESVSGPTEPDAVLSSLDEAERIAKEQADEADRIASKRKANAEQIRTRLNGVRR